MGGRLGVARYSRDVRLSATVDTGEILPLQPYSCSILRGSGKATRVRPTAGLHQFQTPQ